VSISALESEIKASIAEISPQLGVHGGSLEFVSYDPETRVLAIRFLGACEGCMAAEYTLEYGIRELMMIRHIEIDDVIAVNDEPKTHLPPTMSPLYAPGS